jgi:hypothetical protein
MRYSNENKSKANGVVYTPSEMADYVARLMLRYADKNESTEVSILENCTTSLIRIAAA